jgi:hypothetical protein
MHPHGRFCPHCWAWVAGQDQHKWIHEAQQDQHKWIHEAQQAKKQTPTFPNLWREEASRQVLQKGDAIGKWKDAAKGAGPAILDAIKDDVSTYSPFPKSSLSERMEVQDVWDRARANTKSAGKLDGDAKETKNTVENAEAQAESQA